MGTSEKGAEAIRREAVLLYFSGGPLGLCADRSPILSGEAILIGKTISDLHVLNALNGRETMTVSLAE